VDAEVVAAISMTRLPELLLGRPGSVIEQQ